jgi:zinc/manganese transport system substrate-binding protein
MINRRFLLAASTLVVTGILPVSAQGQISPGLSAAPAAPEGNRLKVVASFSILGDLVAQIGGERVALVTLVGPNGDAHVYAPTPSDARHVTEASVLVFNGQKFEGWLDKLVKASGTKAILIEASKGVKTIKLASATGHEHGHGGEADPHLWQDPMRVKTYVANIRDALIAADPAGSVVYTANAVRFMGELDLLDKDAKAAFAKIPQASRKIITSHDAFGYFATAYGVTFIAPRGVSTEAEPSAKDVAKVITQAKREKIKAIFMENITNPRVIEQIARETGAKSGGKLYSDALSSADGPAGTYIAMMQHNIREIVAALGGGST